MADECVRCGEMAHGVARYDFEDGPKKYQYCRACAHFMHERYRIDAVTDGDLDLDL